MEVNPYLNDSYEQNVPNEENNSEKTFVKDVNIFSDKLVEILLSLISKKDESFTSVESFDDIRKVIMSRRNDNFMICDKCKNFQIISFIDENKIKMKCNCGKGKILKLSVEEMIASIENNKNIEIQEPIKTKNEENNNRKEEISKLKDIINKKIDPDIRALCTKLRNEKSLQTYDLINIFSLVSQNDLVGEKLIPDNSKLYIKLISIISSNENTSENYLQSLKNIYNFLNAYEYYKDRNRVILGYKGQKGNNLNIFSEDFISSNEGNIEIFVNQEKNNVIALIENTEVIDNMKEEEENLIIILVEKKKEL